jgi:very-short-patch-repair endonuclease
VADFYCPSAKTIIEVDGIAHDMGIRPELDQARERLLVEKGLRVLRIPASEVLRDVTEVAEALVADCRGPFTIGIADGPPPHSLRERGG